MQRDALANQVCTLATPGARKAMQGVMNWFMRGGGYVWGMEFLEAAMAVRAFVLGEDR